MLTRANPLAKLGAAAALLLVLFISVDLLTTALVLAILVVSIGFSGIGVRPLLGRAWPVLITAVMVGLLNGIAAGTDGWAVGITLALRLLAIVLAGILALASTDPTDMADALQQQLHLPARPAVGALAAMRLLPVLAEEWRTLALARRARGVSADGSPVRWVRLAAGQLLSLLVSAVRRATQLALAMDARGFGSGARRSSARPQRMRGSDWVLLLGGAAVGLAAIVVSLVAGSWRSLFGG
jgi:energy-coupling factor transport system permease protein